jgi:endo-1,3-beta-xylanase
MTIAFAMHASSQRRFVFGAFLAVVLACSACQVQCKPIFFIGQDTDSVDNYVKDVRCGGLEGFTSYTALRDGQGSLNGLSSATNYGAGNVCAKCMLDKYPKASLALGLDLVGTLPSIVAGKLNSTLDELSSFLAATGRTVYLRIGYEADMSHNHYDPVQYKAAFRIIAKHIREKKGLRNVQFVWQLGTSNLGTFGGADVMSWFPGEDVVDWVGGSYFVYHAPSWSRLLGIAQQYSKKVMICESAPQGANLRSLSFAKDLTTGSDKRTVTASFIWDNWFAGYFDFIRSNNIGAVAYINADWDSQSMWGPGGGQGYWGVTSVEVNAEIKKRWEDAVNAL